MIWGHPTFRKPPFDLIYFCRFTLLIQCFLSSNYGLCLPWCFDRPRNWRKRVTWWPQLCCPELAKIETKKTVATYPILVKFLSSTSFPFLGGKAKVWFWSELFDILFVILILHCFIQFISFVSSRLWGFTNPNGILYPIHCQFMMGKIVLEICEFLSCQNWI